MIEFDDKRHRVTAGSWSARVVSMSPTASSLGEREALVSIAPRVNLLIRARDGSTQAHIELWSGDANTSDGVAVTVVNDRLGGIYYVPLCSCGERGCGNSGLQLARDISADDLPVLIDAVVGLRPTSDRPRQSDVWDGAIGPYGPIV